MKTVTQTPEKNRSNIYLLNNVRLNYHRPESYALKDLGAKKLPLPHYQQAIAPADRDVETTLQNKYQLSILQLLDDLQCPLLLLPRVKDEVIERIGLFTDIRFTGIPTLALVVKIAKSLNAQVTVFNVAEGHMPDMDFDYAKRYFIEHGLSRIKGQQINLVHLETKCIEIIECALDENGIQMVAALQKRKDLLYTLAS